MKSVLRVLASERAMSTISQSQHTAKDKGWSQLNSHFFPHFSKDDPPLLPHPSRTPSDPSSTHEVQEATHFEAPWTSNDPHPNTCLSMDAAKLPKTWCYQPGHGRGIGPTEGDESLFILFFWPRTASKFLGVPLGKKYWSSLMNGVGSSLQLWSQLAIQPRLSWVWHKIGPTNNRQTSSFLWQESTMVGRVPNLEHPSRLLVGLYPHIWRVRVEIG